MTTVHAEPIQYLLRAYAPGKSFENGDEYEFVVTALITGPGEAFLLGGCGRVDRSTRAAVEKSLLGVGVKRVTMTRRGRRVRVVLKP